MPNFIGVNKIRDKVDKIVIIIDEKQLKLVKFVANHKKNNFFHSCLYVKNSKYFLHLSRENYFK